MDNIKECVCGNPQFGFDCLCDYTMNHKGDNEYICEFCGIYKANEPRCNKCERNE